MRDAAVSKGLETMYDVLRPMMDERLRRQRAAAEAQAYGWRGVRALSAATGLSAHTVRRGLQALPEREGTREGGGRKRQTELDPGLVHALEQLIDPVTRGDPGTPLRWTCKSPTHLAGELSAHGRPVSASTVRRLLSAAGYSLQGNRKAQEGAEHPDRNEQFEPIAATVQALQQRGHPVISVGTKQKELIGECRTGGRAWQRTGEPVEVLFHDCIDKDLGKAIPYGVYDLTAAQG